MNKNNYFYIMSEEEWANKSTDWKKGWIAGQLGDDLLMNKNEIENMSKDWKDGLKFACLHPTDGYIPMQNT